MDSKSMGLFLPYEGSIAEETNHPSPDKEDPTYTFSIELDDEGFPKIFFLRAQEVSMYLRIVHFFTARIVWSKMARKIETLELLLGLQFLEWFENLSVTSSLLTPENQVCYQIWNFVLSTERESGDFGFTLKREVQKEISQNPSLYGHLTFRHFQSEKRRKQFHNYILTNVLQRREVSRKSLPSPSHFKRSSDHSSTQRGTNGFLQPILTPRVKEFAPEELKEFLGLSPHERKLLLQGESSSNSS